MARGYQQLLEEHWDKLQGQGRTGGQLTPFFPEAQKEPGDILVWLEKTIEILEDEQMDRAIEQHNNVRFYNAIQSSASDDRIRRVSQDGRPLNAKQEFVLNHARDLVHQSVSRLTRFNPEVNVYPQNNEYTDRLGAKFSKRVIDNLFYVNDSRTIVERCLKEAKICGESFLFVEWDPFLGDKDPKAEEFEALIAQGLVPEASFTDSDGEVVNLDIAKRVGDVRFENPLPWFVWHEPAWAWKDVNYIFYGKIKHIDEVRAENPQMDMEEFKPAIIHARREGSYGPTLSIGEYVIEYTFYHRRHRFLDKGFHARFIPGTLLYAGDLPYSHGELPVTRFTDYDDPINAHGVSFFKDIKPPLVMFNKLWNLTYRNLAIGAHPKLMVPEGSCNINSMANGPFVVEYQYPMKPEIISFNTTSPEVFVVTDRMMQQISQLSGTFGISRGEEIKNARAAAILNVYEEQETKREESQIRKKNAFTEKLARLSLATTGDYYRPDDGRLIRIVGKNNRYKVQKVQDVAKLSGPYDVRVEFTSSLAETKQGRIDQIVALSQAPLSTNKNDEAKPGLFTREQVLRMIEVADTEAFFEFATAAADRAESENEDLFEGIAVPPPTKEQAHLIDWNIHFQFIQSREFTDVQGLPPEVRQAFLDHLATHEMWMYRLATKSLSFAQILMENFYFPAVFELGDKPSIAQLIMMHQQPPPPPIPPEAMMAMQQKKQEEEAPKEAPKEEAPPPAEAPQEAPPEEPVPEEMPQEEEAPPEPTTVLVNRNEKGLIESLEIV